MPGSLSNALEIKLLDHVLKNTPFSVLENIYIALSTADPKDDESGIAEPVGGSYTRVVCNAWDVSVSRATENTNKVTFPQATTDEGIITHWAAYDAITSGNFLAHGSFEVSKECPIGANLYVDVGDIDIVFNAGGVCDNLANKLLDHVFKVAEYTPETNLYIALFTSSPTDDGVSGSEVSGGGYVREICNAWDASAAGASQNTADVDFPKATALWGTITHVLLLNHLTDAPSATNTLIWATITPNRIIGIDDDTQYAAGAFDITLD